MQENSRRHTWILILALGGQLILLSAQVPAGDGSQSHLEKAALRVVGPLPRLVARVSGVLASLGQHLRLHGSLLEENRALREANEKLRLEVMRLADLEDELSRLAAALDHTPAPEGSLRLADVVYIDHASWLRTLLLYVGQAGVEVNQAVVSRDGLVGRVVLVAGPYAKVQLITDRASAIGAMIVRTRRQGVIRGSGTGDLELDYVPLQADVVVGDRVVTAGIDGVYPRGLPIGTVVGVEAGTELFHRIRVAPEVDFGRLDQVFVVVRPPVPESVKKAHPGARR